MVRARARARFKAHLQDRILDGAATAATKENAREIGSSCYILRDRSVHRAGPAARYLIWPLSEPRVAVFWPGIVLRGFTFISILITRSLGSRFGTRYPSSSYTYTLPLSPPSFTAFSFLPSLSRFSLASFSFSFSYSADPTSATSS